MIKNITSYNPSKDEKFFFDANIWLHLFCPQANSRPNIREKYNDFFLKAIIAKSKIYTSSQIVSEFFNTYTRIEFRLKNTENPSKYNDYKKDFRNTDEYIELSDGIIEVIKSKILNKSVQLNDNFSHINIDNILQTGTYFDFNDSYFAEMCRNNGLTIVTHDRDFLDLDLDVITALYIKK